MAGVDQSIVRRGQSPASGDVGGTYDAPVVTGIDGIPIEAGGPADGDVLRYDVASDEWKLVAPPGAGGGEANTASNVGTAGTGLFDAKVAVDLQFRKLNSLRAFLSVALDAPNQKVDVSFDELDKEIYAAQTAFGR